MREIKFQVVVGNKIVAHEFSNPAFNMGDWSHVLVADGKDAVIRPGGYTALNLDPVIRRQYIDKKDKNGEEIYEGDIVHTFSRVGRGFRDRGIDKVRYSDITARWYPLDLVVTEMCEVIGNIWENPDLISRRYER